MIPCHIYRSMVRWLTRLQALGKEPGIRPMAKDGKARMKAPFQITILVRDKNYKAHQIMCSMLIVCSDACLHCELLGVTWA